MRATTFDPQHPWVGVSTTVDQVCAPLRGILDAAQGRKLTSGQIRECQTLLDLLWTGVLCHADAVQAIGPGRLARAAAAAPTGTHALLAELVEG